MREISFTIPIIPKAQMRPRHFAKHTKTGKAFTGTYKAPEQQRSELQLMQLLEQYRPEMPFTGAVMISITVFIQIPQTKPGWWKEAAEKYIIPPIGQPDLDNYVKNILDCMEKLSYFNNDSQVQNMFAEKLYSINPRWTITIREYPIPKTKKEYLALQE